MRRAGVGNRVKPEWVSAMKSGARLNPPSAGRSRLNSSRRSRIRCCSRQSTGILLVDLPARPDGSRWSFLCSPFLSPCSAQDYGACRVIPRRSRRLSTERMERSSFVANSRSLAVPKSLSSSGSHFRLVGRNAGMRFTQRWVRTAPTVRPNFLAASRSGIVPRISSSFCVHSVRSRMKHAILCFTRFALTASTVRPVLRANSSSLQVPRSRTSRADQRSIPGTNLTRL